MNRLKTLEGSLIFLAFLIATCLIFTRFALISFLFFLFIISWFTAGRKGGWIEQIIWVYIYFFCFFTLFISFWSLIGLKLNPVEPLAVLAASAWFTIIRHPKKTKRRSEFNWTAIITGLAVSIYVCLPIILHPSSASVLRYSAKTTDDASHIARIEAIRSFGGLLYHRQAETSSLIDSGTSVSPQAWHANGAFLESLIIKLKGSDTTFTRLATYLFYKTLWLFVTVFLLYSLYHQLRQNFKMANSFWFDVLSFASLSAISVFLLVAIFGFGFQDFIAAIGLVCASLIIALQTANTAPKSNSLGLLSLLLLTSAAFYTWTPAGLITGLITLAVLLKILMQRYESALSLRQVVLLAGLVLLSALPVYELIRSGSERGLATLNVGGRTPSLHILGVVILLLLTLVGLYILKPPRRVWLASLLALTSSVFVLLAVYQWISIGETRYYDIKLAFLSSVVLSAAFLVTVEGLASTRIRSKYSPALGILFVVIIIPILLGLDLRKSAYPLKNSAPISDVTAKKILQLSSAPHNKNTIIYTPNKGETLLANKLWSSVQLYNNKDRKALLEKLGQQVNE